MEETRRDPSKYRRLPSVSGDQDQGSRTQMGVDRQIARTIQDRGQIMGTRCG